LGAALDATGYCPMIKRIWTPSWTIFSAGWALLALGGFYGFVDLLGFRRLVWPLAVAGMNPLVLYCISQAIGWPGDILAQILAKYLGSNVFTLYRVVDARYSPIVQMTMIVAAEWLICAWLYRRRIFVRL
jgi:predicted acyltransferase